MDFLPVHLVNKKVVVKNLPTAVAKSLPGRNFAGFIFVPAVG
jgi:hypothetical protein